MPRVKTSGYGKFWPMKQLAGHRADGSKRSVEGYRNMLTGEFYAPRAGWKGRPPEHAPGERDPALSNKYKDNYERIFGHS